MWIEVQKSSLSMLMLISGKVIWEEMVQVDEVFKDKGILAMSP